MVRHGWSVGDVGATQNRTVLLRYVCIEAAESAAVRTGCAVRRCDSCVNVARVLEALCGVAAYRGWMACLQVAAPFSVGDRFPLCDDDASLRAMGGAAPAPCLDEQPPLKLLNPTAVLQSPAGGGHANHTLWCTTQYSDCLAFFLHRTFWCPMLEYAIIWKPGVGCDSMLAACGDACTKLHDPRMFCACEHYAGRAANPESGGLF